MEFAHPMLLWLFPIAVGGIVVLSIWDWRREAGYREKSRGRQLFGRMASGGMERAASRRVGEILLRSLVILLVVLALAGVRVSKNSNRTTNIFLVDLSDSVRDSVEEETDFVRSAIAKLPAKNQAGIVVFGADARIEQFITEQKSFSEFQSEVLTSATNLEQAMETALALFPDETAKRLILLTDGAQNEGNLSEAALPLAGSGAELRVVQYDSEIADEVYVSDVKMPETISDGDSFEVNVEIYASEPTAATVSLYSGRTLKGQKEVTLQKGDNSLVFSDQGVEQGIKSYRVTVEAEKDTVSVNNTYSAFTTVKARPRLLVVEGEKNGSSEFVKVLKAANLDYEVVTPSGVPVRVTDFLQYQSVILVDVYADDLREGFLAALETYVKEYAGGLAAIGGPNSYALGNYRNTPLEEVLPVKMELEGEKQVPKTAMVMVIDHSGSMGSPASVNSAITCMDVAKQAAVNSLDSLRETDEIGVIAFDDTFTWSVPLEEATDRDKITERIAGIQVQGGTSIYPAVEAAVKKIEESDAVLRHVVLLTDGQDSYTGYAPLLEEMGEQNITLSTVAVGEGADQNLLQSLSQKGGGRYYYTDAGSDLPRIFAQEVFLSSKSYLIEEEFVPAMVNSHEILGQLLEQGAPSLLGYVATTPKAAATVLLESDREDPVLAVWQYGLGRAAAWTSDATGHWTANWSGWEKNVSLWRNIIDWTITDTSLGDDQLAINRASGAAVIEYQTQEYSGKTKVFAMVTDEEGNEQQVELQAKAPGRFEAKLPLTEMGVYGVNLRKEEDGEVVGNVNTAAAIQYSREYRFADATNALDGFVSQVGGVFIEKPQEVYDSSLRGSRAWTELTQGLLIAALFLFMADLIFRRLSVDWLSGVRTVLEKVTHAIWKVAGRGWKAVRRVGRTDRETVPVSGESIQESSGTVRDNEAVRQLAEIVSYGATSRESSGTVEPDAEGVSAPQNGGAFSRAQKRAARKSTRTQKRRERAGEQENSVIDTGMLLKKKEDRNV